MKKEVFIAAIESVHKQVRHDIEMSEHLGKVFPNAFEANLIWDNSAIQDAMLDLLKSEMNDSFGWIDYFCWELNFGEENFRLKAYDKDKNEIPLSNAGELYDLLASQ